MALDQTNQQPESQPQHSPSARERLSALRSQGATKEKLKGMKQVVHKTPGLNPKLSEDMKNSVIAECKKIRDFVEKNYKSKLGQAGHYKDLTIVKLQAPITTIANRYHEKVQSTKNVYDKNALKEEFAQSIQEHTQSVTQLVQKYAKEKGWIDGEVMAKLSKSARKFRDVLSSPLGQKIKPLIEYAIIGETTNLSRADFITQTTALFESEFPNGQNADLIWYIMYEVNTADKISVATEIYNKLQATSPQLAAEFLEKGNSKGSFTLANMEEIRGAKYTDEQRKLYNERHKAARDVTKMVKTMAVPYGSQNIWDSINSGTIGKFLLQVGSGITIASNLIINKGRPNEYVAAAGAILAGTHMLGKEQPIGLSDKDKALAPLNTMKDIESDTLVWEAWDEMFTHPKKGEQHIKTMRKYAQYLKDEKGQVPKKLDKKQFAKFLNLKGNEAFKEAYDALPPLAKTPEIVRDYTYVFAEMSTGDNIKAKGIYDEASYKRAKQLLRT